MSLRVAVFCDRFPELSETFVLNEIRALRRAGHEVCVVASNRAENPADVIDLSDMPVDYLTDDSPRARIVSLARACVRAPARAARDITGARSWQPDEVPRRSAGVALAAERLRARGVQHVHAHFAVEAATDALRAGALLGVPVSVTAHAYDIFMLPRNLERKLRDADFTTSGCDYNVRHLRGLVPAADGERIHRIVMGVDPGFFRRKTAYPGDSREVVAIGRLVEKKGFADLIDAVAQLPYPTTLERLTIVGDGPLRERLAAQIDQLGISDRVTLAGSLSPAAIRELLEKAALLAMPCVVAADGDRDSMPVVVKEAMAMELPVVATDEVGLPELVDDTRGRLVPPRDPAALAAALDELLNMPADSRAGLGAAGRAHVIEHCSVDGETAKLAELMRAAVAKRTGAAA